MSGGGVSADGRPLCRCHGEPMHSLGGGFWGCVVVMREAAAPGSRLRARKEHEVYGRARSELRRRIERKRQQIEELERRLEEEVTS